MTPPRTKALDLPLTDDMLETYAFIRAYCAQYGYPPSYREIANGRGKSLTAIVHQLCRLEAAGYIGRRPGGMRTITTLKA